MKRANSKESFSGHTRPRSASGSRVLEASQRAPALTPSSVELPTQRRPASSERRQRTPSRTPGAPQQHTAAPQQHHHHHHQQHGAHPFGAGSVDSAVGAVGGFESRPGSAMQQQQRDEALEHEYLANLKQQIYFLELENRYL
eukprot:TRINITY_DN4135_c0_g1_i2.p3 TRINITY_DN4135_c0_g1~~TRINITY_DN4135_c0_g1_i2.p3  ORF type:complete len:142 (-),score=48.08 TRINITY_DN4135_c0_g1_i2:188-613(-)